MTARMSGWGTHTSDTVVPDTPGTEARPGPASAFEPGAGGSGTSPRGPRLFGALLLLAGTTAGGLLLPGTLGAQAPSPTPPPAQAEPMADGNDARDGSQARSHDDPVRLTLQEAVARALETGQEVRLVEEAVLQAEEEITQVRSGALPEVSGNVTYTRQLRSIFDDVGATPPDMNGVGENPFADLPFGRPNTWIASLSVNQTLYAAGQVSIGLEIADRVRSALQHELAETREELAREVREAYFQAVFADELVAISLEARDVADRQLQEVEGFREQGLSSELDVLTARVERDNLEPRIVEARNAARLARQNLRRLVNLPRDRELELVTRLDAELADVDREALEAAVRERPALQAATEQVRIGLDQVRLARAGYRPTASAFAEFGFQNFPGTVLPQDRWQEDWNVGVQVSVPIFNGFRTRAEVEEARSGVRQAELEREQLEEGLLLEFDTALAEFDAALSQISARRSTVEEAERALELAELRFGAGSATALELSNARLNLQQSRVNEVEALLAYVEALAALEQLTGGRIPLVAPRLMEADGQTGPGGGEGAGDGADASGDDSAGDDDGSGPDGAIDSDAGHENNHDTTNR
ncbi:MAG: TolC family protein [Gemmatimonadales bacterium]|nr:MAG: TolC family protein [Gemmatimonadales bacterium]